MTNKQIEHMVRRFLSWKLPKNFNPDNGISFEPFFNVEYNAKHGKPPQRREPVGTNLLDYGQAQVMVRHMIEGLPDQHLTPPDDLPDELVERVALAMANEDARQVDCPILASVDEFRFDKDRDNYMERARAIAPILIARGRELAGPLPHGTMVRKKDGHEFEGHFLCEYTDMKGRVWWMVELSTPGAKGLMFHFRREQMEPFDRSKP